MTTCAVRKFNCARAGLCRGQTGHRPRIGGRPRPIPLSRARRVAAGAGRTGFEVNLEHALQSLGLTLIVAWRLAGDSAVRAARLNHGGARRQD